MNLRARFALHAGLHAPGDAVAVAAEPTEVDVPDVSEVTCSIRQPAMPVVPVVPMMPVVREEPRDEVTSGSVKPASEPGPGWSGAYAKGVYRLFVRGRATRPARPVAAAEEPRASGPEIAAGPVVSHGDCVAPVPTQASEGEGSAICLAVVSVRASRVEPERASRDAPARVNVVEPAPASRGAPARPSRVDEPPPAERGEPVRVREPVARAAAPAYVITRPPTRPDPVVDPLAMGPEVGGIVRRVVDWPLVPGARPALLGGALARLELPDAARFRGLVPRLLSGLHPQAGGSPVVFLDLETTALDRGAGALAFMVGIAALVDGALRVEQWILTKLSSEAAMLAEVMQRIDALAGPEAVLSSFNGASFDLPLLRTRLRRAGMSSSALERPHLDLLPPARRMWRGRGPDCRLVTLERTQLAVRRVHDIAGHEIPAVFWAWLRRPNDPEVQAVMARVADHNLADLVTLPALAAALCSCMTAPQDLDMAVRSAEHSRAAGRPAEALALLDAWMPRPAAAAQRRRALLLAAELLRRDLASRARAAELWAEVCRISPGDPAAHEALAKYLEHHAGDPARALEVARASASPCPRRLARLQRKLIGLADAARLAAGPGPGPASPVPGPARSVPGPLRSGHLSC